MDNSGNLGQPKCYITGELWYIQRIQYDKAFLGDTNK